MDEDEFEFDFPHYDFTSEEAPLQTGEFFRNRTEKPSDDDLLDETADTESTGPSPKKKMRTHQPARQPQRPPPRVPIMSTEDLQLAQIEAKRQELVKAKKGHEATYKKAIAHGKPLSLKSHQPSTMPQSFRFKSDERIKGTAASSDYNTVDFTKTLRSATSSTGVGSSNDRSKRDGSPVLTVPKTPTLSTKGRTRPAANILTREQELEMEYEKHKNKQFKANKVNQKVFKEPQLPSVAARAATTVKEFNLHHSSLSHLKREAPEENKPGFKANPVNQKILEKPSGLKPVESRPMTIAQSPAFVRGRLRSRELLAHEEKEPPVAPVREKKRTGTVTHHGVPFKPLLEHKFTKTKSFAVEEHSKEMIKRREQKIQQVLDEEKKAREFKASVMPSNSPDALPPKKTKPITEAEPFHLTLDERGERYQQEFKSKQIHEEEVQLKTKAKFHAGSNKAIFSEPFVPDKSNKPLTEMSGFTLNTDQRACRREQFNLQLKENEAKIESLKRQQELRKLKEEDEQVAQSRKNTVHRATSIKKYRNVVPQPSGKLPTVPQSPALSTRLLRSKRQASQDE